VCLEIGKRKSLSSFKVKKSPRTLTLIFSCSVLEQKHWKKKAKKRQKKTKKKMGVRRVCSRFWWGVLFLCSLGSVIYGATRLSTRGDRDCPIPSVVQKQTRFYSSFCNPGSDFDSSEVQNVPIVPINISYWCETLGCSKAPNVDCLNYVTGSTEGSCPASAGGCALSCEPAVKADEIGGSLLVGIGGAVFLICLAVWIWQYRKAGEICLCHGGCCPNC
jgi:hypothetical protein